MRYKPVCFFFCARLLAANAEIFAGGSPEAGLMNAGPRGSGPLVHTYSIVARDPETGNLGVAVQSHWFQVGPIVPWAEAGVGAVATQSFIKVDYGPEGLKHMKEGLSPHETLDRLLAKDPQRDVRQVAMVDAQGRVAALT